jgi:hypothetical protein
MDKIIPLPDYKIEIAGKKLVKCLEIISSHEMENCQKRN